MWDFLKLGKTVDFFKIYGRLLDFLTLGQTVGFFKAREDCWIFQNFENKNICFGFGITFIWYLFYIEVNQNKEYI